MKRKTRKMAALAANPTALSIYENFEQDKAKYAEALQAAQAMPALVPTQVPGMPLDANDPAAPMQPPNPMEVLKAAGIEPPRLSDSLRQAGLEVPTVDWQDDALVQLEALRRWALSDGFEKLPPMVHQLAREAHEELIGKAGQMLSSMTAQEPIAPQGSEKAEKGTPSPPKQPGQPVGAPQMKMPGG
jgi:hypothetical protein